MKEFDKVLALSYFLFKYIPMKDFRIRLRSIFHV